METQSNLSATTGASDQVLQASNTKMADSSGLHDAKQPGRLSPRPLESDRLKALSAEVRDQNEIERDIGRQVRRSKFQAESGVV